MKRNLDLIREILQKLESKKQDEFFFDTEVCNDSVTIEDVQENARLMFQAGLLDPQGQHLKGLYPCALTWKGHDFLDSCRSEVVWQKAKKFVIEKVGGVSFDVMLAYLKKVGKESLGLPVE